MRDKWKPETRAVALQGKGAGSHDLQEPFPVFEKLALPPLEVSVPA
jgi:hypothetical protein